jgi:hypothetical protein
MNWGAEFHIISTVHFDNNSQFKKNQQMRYIIKYCSISPTYVAAPVEPSWRREDGSTGAETYVGDIE